MTIFQTFPFCFYIEKEASGQSYTPEKTMLNEIYPCIAPEEVYRSQIPLSPPFFSQISTGIFLVL